MLKQLSSRMEKVLAILMVVLCVVSLTAGAASARPGFYRGGNWGWGGSWGDGLGWGWNWSGPCQYVYNGAGAWVVSCPSPATSFPYLGEIPAGTVSGHFQPIVQSSAESVAPPVQSLTPINVATTPDNQKNSKDWYNKGVDLGRSGKFNEAITAFDKAIEINPKDSIALKGIETLSKRIK